MGDARCGCSFLGKCSHCSRKRDILRVLHCVASSSEGISRVIFESLLIYMRVNIKPARKSKAHGDGGRKGPPRGGRSAPLRRLPKPCWCKPKRLRSGKCLHEQDCPVLEEVSTSPPLEVEVPPVVQSVSYIFDTISPIKQRLRRGRSRRLCSNPCRRQKTFDAPLEPRILFPEEPVRIYDLITPIWQRLRRGRRRYLTFHSKDAWEFTPRILFEERSGEPPTPALSPTDFARYRSPEGEELQHSIYRSAASILFNFFTRALFWDWSALR